MKKTIITLIVTLLLASCFAAWDNTKPADNQLWNTAASSMRDNWDALEVEMGVDLALNHPYFQAAQPTFKPDGTTALDATDLGRLWTDSDDNKMYVLTATVPTWTPFPTASGTNTWAATQTFSVPAVWTLGVVPNNTFITATDQAGTGTVDLIKANASDVAIIPDGSQLATSGAPSADADIANKKYVDDQVTAIPTDFSWAQHNSSGVLQGTGVNITSTARNALGDYTTTWDTNYADANYSVTITAEMSGVDSVMVSIKSLDAGSVRYECQIRSGVSVDVGCHVQALGLQ